MHEETRNLADDPKDMRLRVSSNLDQQVNQVYVFQTYARHLCIQSKTNNEQKKINQIYPNKFVCLKNYLNTL